MCIKFDDLTELQNLKYATIKYNIPDIQLKHMCFRSCLSEDYTAEELYRQESILGKSKPQK